MDKFRLASARLKSPRIWERTSSIFPSLLLLGGQLHLTLAPQTEFVNSILNFFAAEAPVDDGKVALQPQPVGHILRPRRQIQLGMQLDLALHHRRIGAHRQPQQIFDPRLVHGYIEVDVASRFSLDTYDVSPRGQEGMEKLRLHRLQVGVSVGAVHNGVELGVQRAPCGR